MEEAHKPAEICERFGISKSTLFRWEDNGLIPKPERNQRGERRYNREDVKAIARFVQVRRHVPRVAQMMAEDAPGMLPRLAEFGEEYALFKFTELHDPTGLAELREYSPLHSTTVRRLLRLAVEELEPSEALFWYVIDVIVETSRPAEEEIGILE